MSTPANERLSSSALRQMSQDNTPQSSFNANKIKGHDGSGRRHSDGGSGKPSTGKKRGSDVSDDRSHYFKSHPRRNSSSRQSLSEKTSGSNLAEIVFTAKDRKYHDKKRTPVTHMGKATLSVIEFQALEHQNSTGSISELDFVDRAQLDKEIMTAWLHQHGNAQSFQYVRRIPAALAGSTYGYEAAVYLHAADVFEKLAIRHDDGKSAVRYPLLEKQQQETHLPIHFRTEREKRQTYELAYQTLKYQNVLEDVLSDSNFFLDHPVGEDSTALVVVMLYDLQHRKFALRPTIIGDDKPAHLSEVEGYLIDHRVHLAAALARCRVKNQSQNIDYLLPETVRNQEASAPQLPLYAWINTMKSSKSNLAKSLQQKGYVEFAEPNQLLPEKGKYYRFDAHCGDVLAFPNDQLEFLTCMDLVEHGILILQDKSSSLAAKTVESFITENDECDILHSDVGSGLTTAHIAVMLYRLTIKRVESRELMYGSKVTLSSTSMRSPSRISMDAPVTTPASIRAPAVFACGVRDDVHEAELTEMFRIMGIKNVQLLRESFKSVQPKDEQFNRVKVILLSPQCTRSAVANPIGFMLNEGDQASYAVLKDLSVGGQSKRAAEVGKSHFAALRLALQYPSVEACVYVTRSIFDEENQDVVASALKWQKDNLTRSAPQFVVCPPTLPLRSNDLNQSESGGASKTGSVSKKFLKMKQTPEMNGCFIGILTRAVEKEGKANLTRGALQGLIAPVSRPSLPEKQKSLEEVAEEEEEDEEARKERKSRASKKTNTGGHVKTKQPIRRSREQPKIEANDVNKMLAGYKRHTDDKETLKQSEPRQSEPMKQAKTVMVNATFTAPAAAPFSGSVAFGSRTPDAAGSAEKQGASSSSKVSYTNLSTTNEKLDGAATPPSHAIKHRIMKVKQVPKEGRS